MNCNVNVNMINQVIKINPLSMEEILEVKANELNISFTANFIECDDYTNKKEDKGKIHGL